MRLTAQIDNVTGGGRRPGRSESRARHRLAGVTVLGYRSRAEWSSAVPVSWVASPMCRRGRELGTEVGLDGRPRRSARCNRSNRARISASATRRGAVRSS